MTQFANIELQLIVPSLTNPRKTFNEPKLQELADSIKASGVHQPILLRPLPGSRVGETSHVTKGGGKLQRATHELVCGERRYRASLIAGTPTIPAMIKDLTDTQVREIQIVENLQRDDLTELEEAEGYQDLMQHAEINADQVGEKIGKSRSYVYSRLKLLDLSVECKTALREGKIDASRALLIARIPDSKLQLKALEYASKPQSYPPEIPSVRSLQNWLRDNVMLRLEHAIFKITDSRLVEGAGSCKDCPKRTGANPDLFAELDSADICTDPKCYHDKEDAHRAQIVKKAEAKGLRIVQDKEALELLNGQTWRPSPPDYSDLHTKRADLSNEGDRPMSLSQVLGKDAPAPILFIHPRTKEAIEMVPTEEAEAVLLAKGLLKADGTVRVKSEDLQEELEDLQERIKLDAEVASRKALHAAAVNAIKTSSAAQAKQLLTGEVLRAYLFSEIELVDADDVADAIGYEFPEEGDGEEALVMHIQRMGDTELQRAVALSILGREGFYRHETKSPIRDAFVAQLAVDTKAAKRQGSADAKAQHAEELSELQAQIAAAAEKKAPPATAPAARPKVGAGGGKEKRSAGSAAAAKKTLSAEEATQGIAAAMQSVEASASANAVAPTAQPEVGSAVRVVTDTSKLSPLITRLAGRDGVVAKVHSDGYLTVKLKKGGSNMFARDQVEVVA